MAYSSGLSSAQIFQGRVVNVNLVSWTVDVISKFDDFSFFDIPIASGYLHHSNGEGISVMPEVGATALVCKPSDSSTPFVLAFLMVSETIDTATEEDPDGTTGRSSSEDQPTTASFAGGRPKSKPGDICLRTRDDNFVILHRGGVLQLGADILSQRIYIPMNHAITDISQNYTHHNSGGSIVWGLQEGMGETEYPSEHTQSFRVLANDKFADVRVKVGSVRQSVPEAGDYNCQSDIDELGIQSDIVVYEVDICPGGFNAESGSLASDKTARNIRMKFFADRAGGTFLKATGSIFIGSNKKIRIKATEGVEINSGKGMSIAAEAEMDVKAKNVHIQGKTIRLGEGQQPVATKGSAVQMIVTFPQLPQPGGPPMILTGFVSSGVEGVLA